jgi:hypothetical protein
MGRSYWFECARCGYRAKVSGRADRGLHFFVQTVACLDCKQLYDAVTRLRIPAELRAQKLCFSPDRSQLARANKSQATPPTFQAALNRLPFKGVPKYQWLRFKTQCPVSSGHRVQDWNEPDKCPRCGLFMEKNVLPYRIWE